MKHSGTASFKGVRIVINLDWYGAHYCFHIDPGDGSTLPIYLDADRRERLTKKVNAIQSDRVDIVVFEVPWSVGDRSGIKRYLKTIKESNAR